MSTASQSTVNSPGSTSAPSLLRVLGNQWRHYYLPLAAVFAVIWRVSTLAIPQLENTRVMNLWHPLDVLLLMNTLELLWVLPLVAVVLYGASFAVPRLNTAGAIAVSALCSIAVLTFVLILALIRISV